MNLLFLSHLHGRPHAGPTYSVPNQVMAQSEYDNVFWYNTISSAVESWKKISMYHDLSDFPKGTLSDLPEPFCRPDLIIIEGFYGLATSKIVKEIIRESIPFVIVPRGELTAQAQKRHHLKKSIANIIKCYSYAGKAAAIQYLTKQEEADSGEKWNKKSLIIPNGINMPEIYKREFSHEGVRCISIGRIEPYQKGLDLLIDACIGIKEELQSANCTILLCGPDRVNKLKDLQQKVLEGGLKDIISFHDGVFGNEKVTMLLSHDVFLMPSRFEGHPLALIEAMSYGLPCVATTGSNMREEIDDMNAGWTSDTTEDGIKEALRRMIRDKQSIEEKGLNARELASKYNWSNIAAIGHESYGSLIS